MLPRACDAEAASAIWQHGQHAASGHLGAELANYLAMQSVTYIDMCCMPWFYHFFAQAHVSMLSTCGESPRMKTSAASSRGRTSWSEEGHSKVDAVLCSIVGTCRCLEQP